MRGGMQAQITHEIAYGRSARGLPAARFRVALIGSVVFTLPSVLWPLMPDAHLAFALLFVSVFGLGIAQSAGPAAIQAVVPNRMRGQAIAVSLLLAGLLGIGLGPTAVALVTDHVFRHDAALRYAVACTAALAALFGPWLISSGVKPYASICVFACCRGRVKRSTAKLDRLAAAESHGAEYRSVLFALPKPADRAHRREHPLRADPVAQHADALDLRFDHIARLQEAAIFEPDATRRSRENQIARP